MQKTYTLYSLRKRIVAILVLFSFLFCALAVRMFVIQIINGSSLQQKATSQWTRDISIVAPRGKIKDKNGNVLSVSYTTYSVYVRAREIKNPTETATFLSNILDIKYSNIYNKLINKGVSESLISLQIEADVAEKIFDRGFEGVYLAENNSRYYPYGDTLSQVLGFTSIDGVGQAGIEASLNSELTGINGYSFTQSDVQGKEIGGSLRYYVSGIKGNDVSLTIDVNIQLILEKVLNQIMEEQKAKGVSGIVLNPNTGEIIALSSKPSFDLNNVPRDDIAELFDMAKVKAVIDTYEPGSTFKILTLACALEHGLTNEKEKFYCSGSYVVDGQKIKCWKSTGHGSQTLKEGFANSCNCVFMQLALRIGTERFYEFLKNVGIGQKTGIAISGESGGIMLAKERVTNVDLARIGFGHAVAVTPIQLLTTISSIINGGNLNTPYLIESIENSTASYSKKRKSQVVSQSTSETIKEFMRFAVNKTGEYTFVEGYNIGGKTGTAQKYDENGQIARGKYISSFIGTYPADNPQYVVMIMVDEPGAGAYYGGVVASPYGKIFYSELFEYLGEEKQDKNATIEYVSMPEVTGLSLADAVELLFKVGLEYELDGFGTIVKEQLPPAGTKLQKGAQVVLVV